MVFHSHSVLAQYDSVVGVFDDVAVLVRRTHVICVDDEQECRQYAALGSSGVDGDLFRVSLGCFHVLHSVCEEVKYPEL